MANGQCTPRICAYCRTTFMARMSEMSRGRARFCSQRCGRLFQIPPLADRFWSKVDRSAGQDACWTWTAGRITDGYGGFKLNGKITPAHRIAWELTFGPIAEGLLACHRCDHPPCCNPTHLFLGTVQDNSDDMVLKGRQASGDRNWAHRHSDRMPRGEAHHTAKRTKDLLGREDR